MIAFRYIVGGLTIADNNTWKFIDTVASDTSPEASSASSKKPSKWNVISKAVSKSSNIDQLIKDAATAQNVANNKQTNNQKSQTENIEYAQDPLVIIRNFFIYVADVYRLLHVELQCQF